MFSNAETHSIIAIGSGPRVTVANTMGPPVLPPVPIPVKNSAQKAAISRPSHFNKLFPNLNISAFTSVSSAISFPQLRPAPINPGYQEAHQYWDMQTFFAGKAYSNVANAEVVITKVWMMTHAPNKKNPSCVSVCNVRLTSKLNIFSFICLDSFWGNITCSCSYWGWRPQILGLLRLTTTIPGVVKEFSIGNRSVPASGQGLGGIDSKTAWCWHNHW